MSILEEIETAAVDGQSDLGTLLRKCKVLAARLDSQPLADWVLWESNGYPSDAKVPDYRILTLQLKGHFTGPFGSGIRNASIPMVCVPEKLRSQFEAHECKMSIASLEHLTKTESDLFQVNTGDLSVVLGSRVYSRMNCLSAWGEVGSPSIVEILNSVRNRILDFALAISKQVTKSGEVTNHTLKVIDPSKVTQIFYTTIYEGGSATLVGSAVNSNFNTSIVQGDFSTLRKYLEENGVVTGDLDELQDAIKKDDKVEHKGNFGPKVAHWLGKMATKAAEETWKAGVTQGLKILTDAILKYYGQA